jgi:hypothetical protein
VRLSTFLQRVKKGSWQGRQYAQIDLPALNKAYERVEQDRCKPQWNNLFLSFHGRELSQTHTPASLPGLRSCFPTATPRCGQLLLLRGVNHRWVWPLPPRNEHRRVRPSLHGVAAHCVESGVVSAWFAARCYTAALPGQTSPAEEAAAGQEAIYSCSCYRNELGTEPPWTDTSEYCKCYILSPFLNIRYFRSVKQIYLDIF